MFYGTYTYKIDEKGRVPLPPNFRRQTKGSVMLKRGMDKCIEVYPTDVWDKLAGELAARVVSPLKRRRLNRIVFGSAFNASFDKQGRIMLPAGLREYAEITDVAAVVGANDRIELWNEKLLEEEKTIAEQQESQIIEEFGV
jgi:MraZ protein